MIPDQQVFFATLQCTTKCKENYVNFISEVTFRGLIKLMKVSYTWFMKTAGAEEKRGQGIQGEGSWKTTGIRLANKWESLVN